MSLTEYINHDAGKINKKRRIHRFIRLLAIGFSLLHLYISTIGSIGTIEFRIIHFIGAVIIIYLLTISDTQSRWSRVSCWVFVGFSIVTGFYILFQYEQMTWRVSYPTVIDFILAIVAFIIALDVTRRTIGWSLPIITLCLLLYGMFGQYIPGQFGHSGYTLQRIVVSNYVTTEGMFGTPLGLMARLIFVFILFGVTLEVSGAGSYFLNIAKSMAGRLIGGPAKMAIIGSGLFGSMSGSAVANTVATGSLTIPLMKRTGYKPHVAAAIEAASSTGGQMVPPIMGAAAFLIGEYTGTSYVVVALSSILPALVYYGSVYTFVHLEARKQGITGLPKSEVPPFWETFKSGYYYFIPVIVIVIMFMLKFSVAFSATIGTVLLIGIMLIKNRGKLSLVLDALEKGAVSAVKISTATICAGIVVGIVAITGVGIKFSGLMIELASGKLFLAVLLVGLASFILGMGLPVVASYIILIVVAGVGLEELGIPLLAAHLLVFWFSQLSNVTPPVALAAYAGAGLASADPMKTGMYACRIAIGLPLIPIMFVYRPMLLGISDASWIEILLHNGIVLLGIIAVIASFQGFLLRKSTVRERLLLFATGICLLINIPWLNLLAGVVLLLLYISQRTKKDLG